MEKKTATSWAKMEKKLVAVVENSLQWGNETPKMTPKMIPKMKKNIKIGPVNIST